VKAALLLAFTIPLQPLVSEDVLEPSVRNEVDHALSLAPTNAFAEVSFPTNAPALCCLCCRCAQTNAPAETAGCGCADVRRDVFGTNGLSSTEVAIKLISLQKSDGRWLDGTNDVSAVAVGILRSL